MMSMALQFLFIGLFGAAGAISRFIVHRAALRVFGDTFPVGTLLVNVIGCLLLGILAGAVAPSLSERMRMALAFGYLGALTTFSTFGMETLTKIQEEQWTLAGLNVAGNVILGLGAAWLGLFLGRLATQG